MKSQVTDNDFIKKVTMPTTTSLEDQSIANHILIGFFSVAR